ncbi:MAG: hypothetical protein LBI78_00250 [Campylobacteraceae bacterium]|nr:hypothetical protein [Campylobacteraceae bacterium]
MSKNKDEILLFKRKISAKSPYLQYEQALRIALFAHYQNYEKFKAANTLFDNFPIFSEALHVQLDAIGALGILFEKYNVPFVKNNCKSYAKLSDNITQICEICIADELKMILVYDELLDFCSDKEDIEDTFYRLQALSCNELLPNFRTFVYKDMKNHQSNDNTFSQNQLLEKFNEFGTLANNISNGNIDSQKINSILGSLNLSMLSGAVLGALGTVFTKEMGKEDTEEKT